MTDLFQTGVRPAIDEWLLAKSKEVRDYGDYWSASSAGYCQRKVIFERLGVPHVESDDDARKQRVFTAGHLFHAWAQGITKEAGLSIASEVELQDEDLMVRGHFDDLILVKGTEYSEAELEDLRFAQSKGMRVQPKEIRPDRLILYDYKTRNSKNFNYSKSPSYFHRLQLGTYTYMLRSKSKWDFAGLLEGVDGMAGILSKLAPTDLSEARVLNIEKDTLRMSEVQYLWDAQLESDVLEYWNSLNTHWQAKTLPRCSCGDQENGFMAKEKWNNYYYEGEPCSLAWYNKWKEDRAVA